MDRVIIYPGEIVAETHLLATNRNAMCAVGDVALTTFGSNTLVNGLALTPTSPASMTINVGPGSIYSVEEVDAVAYSSLGTDTTQNTMKQGLNLSATQFTLTAPSSGNTTAYLIEAQFQEPDTDPLVLPYYNSANPNVPWSGPNNSGNPQNTLRTGIVALQLKSATYATGGTPSIPAVDAGWVGLYLITVNGGQTSITSGNLANAQYPGAPFPPVQMQTARFRATQSIVVPVSTFGSDSWTQPTPLTPFATMARAVSYLQNQADFDGQTGTILLGAGTFSGTEVQGLCLGQVGALVIQGDGSANTTLTSVTGNTMNVIGGAQVTFTELSIGATAGDGIYCGNASIVNNGTDLKFLACGGAHIHTEVAGAWVTSTSYTITGGAAVHWKADAGGDIYSAGQTITLSGTPAFSQAFIVSTRGGVRAASMTYAGSATGTQYQVTLNGVLDTGGALSAVPGTASSGTTATGGQAV